MVRLEPILDIGYQQEEKPLKLPELRIGNLVARLPIVQGGMAVKISTAALAGAVAREGGVGVLAGTGLSQEEVREEIRRARKISSGILGINVLFAVKNFAELVQTAIAERIDVVFSGAGFSRDMFGWGRESGTPIVPIVSSARLASMAEKLGASAVVVEGKEAGGHLGTDRSMRDIVPEVRQAVNIPVIAAGGVIDGRDVAEALRLGADGVQMGTRFAASEESNAPQAVKEMYVASQAGDVVLMKSPVGLPARGLRNAMSIKLEADGKIRIRKCNDCLKRCSRSFCILEALHDTVEGRIQSAAVFCGQEVGRIKEILPVREIFRRLVAEAEAV